MESITLALWIRPRELGRLMPLGNMWSNWHVRNRPDQRIFRGVQVGVSDLGGVLHRIKINIVLSFDEDEAHRYD
jgi:hypothetical protein